MAGGYDPFAQGEFSVATRSFEAKDEARRRVFPIELWYPESRQPHALIVYSHSSGGNRRSSTFLCTHLASHGYAVAALDHSERVAPELKRREGETEAETAIRAGAITASRVPDLRFLIDQVLADKELPRPSGKGMGLGAVGHSAGGWTALATPESDERIASVVAMVPGGSSNPKPGILPVTLTFAWKREIATLYIAGADDVMIPVDRINELYDRTPGPKRMFILRGADHQHFIDNVEGEHEGLRRAELPGDAAWIPKAMKPISELATGEQAHFFVRGLALAHFDATLRHLKVAADFLDAFPIPRLRSELEAPYPPGSGLGVGVK